MTRLLLDHPWPIDSYADPKSDGFQVLVQFEKLLIRQRLSPVPFFEPHEFENAIKNLNAHTTASGTIYRFAKQCVRNRISAATATPVHTPNPTLSENWKRALRDEIDDTSCWRTPQIVIPEKRRGVWPLNANEIPIQFATQSCLALEHRVLVELDPASFESHPYAGPDLDPWRHLEWLHRPSPGAKNSNPCRLPKPPQLEGLMLEEIVGMLPEVRRRGWQIGDKYFYIPPDSCDLVNVEKAKWRDGRAFPRAPKKEGDKIGPILLDFQGRKWVWDQHPGGNPGERHWDVQFSEKRDDYKRVAYDGQLLSKK